MFGNFNFFKKPEKVENPVPFMPDITTPDSNFDHSDYNKVEIEGRIKTLKEKIIADQLSGDIDGIRTTQAEIDILEGQLI